MKDTEIHITNRTLKGERQEQEVSLRNSCIAVVFVLFVVTASVGKPMVVPVGVLVSRCVTIILNVSPPYRHW